MAARRDDENYESEKDEEDDIVAEIEQLGKWIELLEVRQRQLEQKIDSQEAKQSNTGKKRFIFANEA